MARKAKAVPTVADDRVAIVGLWIDSTQSRLFRVNNSQYGLEAYVVTHDGGDTLEFGLDEHDGKRVLCEEFAETDGDHRNPLYEYHLHGDRLELTLLPGAAPVYGEARELSIRANLAGTWHRVRINSDA